jgi:hypothetical protein
MATRCAEQGPGADAVNRAAHAWRSASQLQRAFEDIGVAGKVMSTCE